MGTAETVYLILSILFLLVCAFFSSAEIGFINLQRVRLKHLQEEEVRGADRVARIMKHPERFLSTVLTGVSFAETIVVSLGTIFIVALLGERAGTPVAIVVIALLLLIFAKVIPKTIAAQHPERIALMYGGAIEFITKLLYPLVVALSWTAAKIARLTHSSTVPGSLMSREELRTVISMGEEDGVVDEHSARMLHSVVGLGDRQVREIMTPRTEASWLEQGATVGDLLESYAESPALRYPVYQETYDNVKGMLSVRDVLSSIAQGSMDRRARITELVRPVYFVPERKTVGELFGEMRSEGYHMAVIVDEYGGSSGIVTIDQLIEEIVGEIEQEIVGAEKPFEVMRDGTYRISGSMRVDEANEKLQLGLPEGDYTTMGGFALDLFGHLPQKGEQAIHGDLDFLASEVRENKIIRLIVTRQVRPEAAEAAAGIDPSETESGTPKGSTTSKPSGAEDQGPAGGADKRLPQKRTEAGAPESSSRKGRKARKR